MAQHKSTRLEFAVEDLQPEARDKAYAEWLPFCDRDNLGRSYATFLESCDTYEWRFYADGSAVKEQS